MVRQLNPADNAVDIPTPNSSGGPAGNPVDRFFAISARGSTIGTEIRGGVVTFLTMAYIIRLNPIILSGPDSTGGFLGGGTGGNVEMIAAATALVAGLMSIAMGLVTNFPATLAAGMGLNAMVAFGLALMPGMTWADAMGIVVLQGLIILALVLFGTRAALFRAIPVELRLAISVGIGLFLAFIGVVDAGFVQVPAAVGTPVELGMGGSLNSWPLVVFVFGLLLAMVLMVKRVRGALLIAILAATVLAFIGEALGNLGTAGAWTQFVGRENPGGWALTVPRLPDTWFALPRLGTLGQFSLFGSFRSVGVIAALMVTFTYMMSDFFDSLGSMLAVGGKAGLLDDDGAPANAKAILAVDSAGAVVGGLAGVSSNTMFIEAAAGVAEGARTGLAAVTTGVLFLFATFAAPLVAMIPAEAANPALVAVGFLMLAEVRGVDWRNLEVAFPAFLTIVLMPFTFSITTGIGAGIIAYCVIKLALGKGHLVHPLLYGSAVAFLIVFLERPLLNLLGG